MKPQDPTQPTQPESASSTLTYKKPLSIQPLHSFEVEDPKDEGDVPQESEFDDGAYTSSPSVASASVPTTELDSGGFRQEAQNPWANEKAGPPPPPPLEGQDAIDEQANEEAKSRIPISDKGFVHYLKVFILTLVALAVLTAAGLAAYIFTRPSGEQQRITARIEQQMMASPLASLLSSDEAQAKNTAQQLANAVVACNFSRVQELVTNDLMIKAGNVSAEEASRRCSEARKHYDEVDFSFVKTVDVNASSATFEYKFSAVGDGKEVSSVRQIALAKQDGVWQVTSTDVTSKQSPADAHLNTVLFF
ncbi:hypothetical protein CYG49_02060 [Candidatus Saccharibacteria bacterium]|nr:MAG: hypothetical protein CYG49_02060 [Candidatus Saccharibacteria bacterium]